MWERPSDDIRVCGDFNRFPEYVKKYQDYNRIMDLHRPGPVKPARFFPENVAFLNNYKIVAFSLHPC
jgi:hypothetical protein